MWMFARGGGSGDKVLAARKEQGQVLIVILCAKQLPHADWLLDVQRVNAQPPTKNCVVIYIMVSYAGRCMLDNVPWTLLTSLAHHVCPAATFPSCPVPRELKIAMMPKLP